MAGFGGNATSRVGASVNAGDGAPPTGGNMPGMPIMVFFGSPGFLGAGGLFASSVKGTSVHESARLDQGVPGY